MSMLHSELKLGVVQALRRRDFLLAEQLCRQAEPMAKEDPDILLIRGAVYSEQGLHAEACSALARAHKAAPRRADIAYNYGVALQRSNRLTEAVDAWAKTTHIAPENAAAWLNLALATADLGSLQSALAIYRSALRRHPKHCDLIYNCANLLSRMGKAEKSETQYRALLSLNASHALGWINYGLLLKPQRRFAEAETAYREAMRVANPELAAHAEFNLANLLLQQGRWKEGFAAYEARLRLPGAPANPWGLPEWHPQLPAGSRILVWSDQGLGDALMFLRFIEPLARRGYRVSVFVQNSLRSLAASTPGVEAAFSPDDLPGKADAALALGSLPHALAIRPEESWSGPYVSPPEGVYLPPPKKARRIGLVWAGNPNHANDANRSTRFSELRALFELQDIEWFSLQLGAASAQLAQSPLRHRVTDLGPHLHDFIATAGILQSLDLLISIDSAPAHLAGALGRPVWTLLPAIGADWRWKPEGTATAWYPSMRLFRQPRAGDWKAVIGLLREALSAG